MELMLKYQLVKTTYFKNGEKILNDTIAVIKGNRTYLPIRIVLEAFDASVNWDKDNETVIITSQKYQEYLNRIKNLNKKMRFIVDERLFTLYAFMNYTGYDDENNELGMHPVRKAIRKELKEMKMNLRYSDYYNRKGVDWDNYSYSLSAMGQVPDFEYQKGYRFNSNLYDLDDALREFT